MIPIKEAAQMLGINMPRVRNLVNSGKLKGSVVDGNVMVASDSLTNLINTDDKFASLRGAADAVAGKVDLPSTPATPDIDIPKEMPKVDMPKAELPKVDMPDAPKIDVPDVPEVELPKAEMPKVDMPDVDVPEVEALQVEAPQVEVPQVEMPKVEVPDVPEVELPKAEMPKVDVPEVELPEVEMPKAEMPKAEMPAVEKPVIEKPVMEKPKVEAPKIESTADAPDRTMVPTPPQPSSGSPLPMILIGLVVLAVILFFILRALGII